MQKQRNPVSAEVYLQKELLADRKHEFVDGEIYALAGASRRHNLLATNLIRLTATAAKNNGHCHVFGSDMKVHVAARNCFYYPDVSVSCDSHDLMEYYLTRACCVIEVLSPATAMIDRREKRIAYASLASLKEYIVVDQDRMRVDVYPREGGPWLVRVLTGPDDIVEISCLGLRLKLREIYDGVEFPSGVREGELAEYAAVAW